MARKFGTKPAEVQPPCVLQFLWTGWREGNGFHGLNQECTAYGNAEGDLGAPLLLPQGLDHLFKVKWTHWTLHRGFEILSSFKNLASNSFPLATLWMANTTVSIDFSMLNEYLFSINLLILSLVLVLTYPKIWKYRSLNPCLSVWWGRATCKLIYLLKVPITVLGYAWSEL